MLKTVAASYFVLFFSGSFYAYKVQKKNGNFKIEIICDVINVFVTFKKLYASLLDKKY